MLQREELWNRRKKEEEQTQIQKKKGEKRVKILSWKITGLKNLNEDFCKNIEQFDIVGFQETWSAKKVGK